eukprot:8271604-Alexandrium_andersonii.AAC.1
MDQQNEPYGVEEASPDHASSLSEPSLHQQPSEGVPEDLGLLHEQPSGLLLEPATVGVGLAPRHGLPVALWHEPGRVARL